jgi:N-terminal acetyltransferase B complex non-catalytic subunit
VAENLMLIIDPASDATNAAAQLWLKRRFEDSPDKQNGHEGSGMNPSVLTASETISTKAHSSMVNIILRVGDQANRSDPESASAVKPFNEDLSEAIEMQLAHVSKIKDDALAAKDTLHILYTAYALGTAVLKFVSYLSSTKQDV